MKRRLREALLWAGAALGLVAITTGVAVAFLGFNLLVFRSGSMAPDIPTGALALARTVDAADITRGDVVGVIASGGERITHRVVSSTLRGDQANLVLKGDANAAEDSEIYQVTQAEKVVVSVPYGGYVLTYLLTPPGLVAASALALMLVVVGFAPGGDGRGRRAHHDVPRHRSQQGGRRRATAVSVSVVTAVVVVTGIGSGVERTWAAFNDRATVATGSFVAGAMAAPARPTLSQAQTTGAASISFTPSTVANVDAPSYDVVRYTSATGGAGTVVCADVTPPLTCSEPKPPTAAASTTYYYGVVAQYPVNWSRESTDRTEYTPDVVAPSGSYTTPTTSTANNATCGTAAVCGSAADPAGVAKVEYTLLRTRMVAGALLPTYACWNGAAGYGAATNNACPTFNAATGTTSWSVPGPRTSVYATAALTTQTFSLVIRLTDNFGNVRTSAPISY